MAAVAVMNRSLTDTRLSMLAVFERLRPSPYFLDRICAVPHCVVPAVQTFDCGVDVYTSNPMKERAYLFGLGMHDRDGVLLVVW